MVCTVITKSEQNFNLHDSIISFENNQDCYLHYDFLRKKVKIDVFSHRQVNADGGDVSGGCVLGRG